MKKRIKITRPAIRSREEMESVVGEITLLKNNQKMATAKMDEEIHVVRERYEGNLAEIAKSLDEKMELARNWAEAHPAEFGNAKSIDMVEGRVGWRTGNPALKPLSGWTWDRVLEKLKALGGLYLTYVRTKEEVNKQAILSDRETMPEMPRLIGCRVVQEEEFFVEPKLTQVDNRISELVA